MTHICVSKLTIIGSDNGLSPDRRQAIIWTNAGILSIGPLGTKLSKILIVIHIFSFNEVHLKMSSEKWQPSCLGLNVLKGLGHDTKNNWENVASPMHHLKDENGTLITDRVEIVNTLGAAIEKSSSSENYSKEFQSTKALKEKQKINFKTNKNLRYNKKFTMRDLKRSLKKSNHSSPGPDQIHYEILRHLPIETLHILLDIINETWKSDTFPESWRESLIISILKPGKGNFNPLNYRPIALTSCICKTVERMANERLVWYLEKNGSLAKQQCGYRSNRSTVDHLVRRETFIRDAFIHNQHLVAVFFDLQKAYDTTWKYGILQDLYSMGLRGNLPIFICNLLSDRTFQIHLGTILSDISSGRCSTGCYLVNHFIQY